MNCQWCGAAMAARSGKRYCSTRCRVRAARYKAAWSRYEQAARVLDKEYSRRLVQMKLVEDAS